MYDANGSPATVLHHLAQHREGVVGVRPLRARRHLGAQGAAIDRGAARPARCRANRHPTGAGRAPRRDGGVRRCPTCASTGGATVTAGPPAGGSTVNAFRYRLTGPSRSTRPSSRSCITAIAVRVFEIDAIRTPCRARRRAVRRDPHAHALELGRRAGRTTQPPLRPAVAAHPATRTERMSLPCTRDLEPEHQRSPSRRMRWFAFQRPQVRDRG